MEQESCRENGLVIINDCQDTNMQDLLADKGSFMKQFFRLLHCFPVRIQAVHDCFPQGMVPKWFLVVFGPILKWAMQKRLRLRYLVHMGNPSEILVKLEHFGFLRHQIPVELGGTVEFASFLAWLEERRAAGL